MQEHLILVCELLRANLYEFPKYKRESGDAPYFTRSRVQRIATQAMPAVPALPAYRSTCISCWCSCPDG